MHQLVRLVTVTVLALTVVEAAAPVPPCGAEMAMRDTSLRALTAWTDALAPWPDRPLPASAIPAATARLEPALRGAYGGHMLEMLVASSASYVEGASHGTRVASTYSNLRWNPAAASHTRGQLVLRATWHQEGIDREIGLRFDQELTPQGWRVTSITTWCPPAPTCV